MSPELIDGAESYETAVEGRDRFAGLGEARWRCVAWSDEIEEKRIGDQGAEEGDLRGGGGWGHSDERGRVRGGT